MDEAKPRAMGKGSISHPEKNDLEGLKRSNVELRERLVMLQTELDLRDREDAQGTLARLREVADRKTEEAERLADELRQAEAELQMRIDVAGALRRELDKTGGQRGREQALDTENQDLKERLSLALTHLESLADRDGLREQVDRAMARAEEAESERVRASGEATQERERYQAMAERARQAEAAAAIGQDQLDRLKKRASRALAGIFLLGLAVGVTGARLVLPVPAPGSGEALPSPTPFPSPTREVAAAGSEEVTTQVLGLLEQAAHRRLDRTATGLPAPPVPPEVRDFRGEGAAAAMARLAKGAPQAEVLEELRALARARQAELDRLEPLVARLLFLSGREEESRALLRSALLDGSVGVEGRVLEGELLLSSGQVGPAGAVFRTVLEAAPDHARARAGLANVLELEGEAAAAESELARAIAADPAHPHYRFSLAMLLRRRSDWPGMIRELEAVRDLSPRDPDVHWYLAEAYQAHGDSAAATAARTRATELGYRGNAAQEF